ncbi:hypothetical protein RR42_m0164 [Cupriavidus basilensis]|uniref:Uncharacterized protein n=1 Tax=Cupriavidus basilensis TaxID=68895 RepID=A0A0C4Y659_9BURK|nr:hypothetical protein RR42_m0164 [Cupriavidus basilensis]
MPSRRFCRGGTVTGGMWRPRRVAGNELQNAEFYQVLC